MAVPKIWNGSAWVPVADGQASIPQSLLTTRGDLIRRGASAPERVALGAAGSVLSSDGTDATWISAMGALTHDHARPAWSGTATRTTSFTCPSNANILFLQLAVSHANASGVWDVHFYVGTTSGGSQLFALGGLNGFFGYSGGTGTPYPYTGSYPIPITAAQRGTTMYVTSYAPAGNYYLAGDIKIFAA